MGLGERILFIVVRNCLMEETGSRGESVWLPVFVIFKKGEAL